MFCLSCSASCFVNRASSGSLLLARYSDFRPSAVRGQLQGWPVHQRRLVPPQARVERDVAVEQVRLGVERLHHEQPRERLAHDRGLPRGPVARVDHRHQFGADEVPERGRAADVHRDLPVFGILRRPGHVATAFGVLDAHEQERPHRRVADGHLDQARDVQEVLGHAAVGHVQHRARRIGRVAVERRSVDVDAADFAEHLGLDGERLAHRERDCRAGALRSALRERGGSYEREHGRRANPNPHRHLQVTRCSPTRQRGAAAPATTRRASMSSGRFVSPSLASSRSLAAKRWASGCRERQCRAHRAGERIESPGRVAQHGIVSFRRLDRVTRHHQHVAQ